MGVFSLRIVPLWFFLESAQFLSNILTDKFRNFSVDPL